MLDFTHAPPKRWIQASIRNLHVALPGDDELLATLLVGSGLYYLYGPHETLEGWPDATHRYGNGAWALMVLNRDDEAWELYKPLRRVGQTMLDTCDTIPISSSSLLVFIYLALRLGHAQEAHMGIALARKRGLHPRFGDDLEMLSAACLRQRPHA